MDNKSIDVLVTLFSLFMFPILIGTFTFIVNFLICQDIDKSFDDSKKVTLGMLCIILITIVIFILSR